MKVQRHEEKPCPFCNHMMDSTTGIGHDHAPRSGDLTMCIECGEWCFFTDDLKLRKPIFSEYEEIVSNPSCARMRAAWIHMNAKRKAKQ